MTTASVRLCSPCKAEGKRVPAGLGKSGRNDRRARVNGSIVNVCDMHGDALTVVRATVSGRGATVRQSAETAIFTADASALAARTGDLALSRREALSLLTQTHIDILMQASRRAPVEIERDALFDEMLDACINRIGDRAFRGEPADVDAIVYTATCSNTSVRARRQDARLDRSIDTKGTRLLDVLDREELEMSAGWRVGGMTVSVADMALLVAAGRPADLSDEDWATLTAVYA